MAKHSTYLSHIRRSVERFATNRFNLYKTILDGAWVPGKNNLIFQWVRRHFFRCLYLYRILCLP